jgi:hypothetical protein
VLLVSTVLQTNGNDFSHEYITIDDYGYALIALTLIVIPIAIYFLIDNARTLRQLKNQLMHEDAEKDVAMRSEDVEFDNPLIDEEEPRGESFEKDGR